MAEYVVTICLKGGILSEMRDPFSLQREAERWAIEASKNPGVSHTIVSRRDSFISSAWQDGAPMPEPARPSGGAG